MDPFLIDFHGVALPGHTMTNTEARTEAAQWLGDNGHGAVDLDTADVSRAWWAGEHLGFCGEAHPLAQPVTIVAWQQPATP